MSSLYCVVDQMLKKKIQNLLQILLTFTVQIYIRHMSSLMLFRTVVLQAI